MFKSRRPLFTSYGPTFPLKNKHMKRREINLNRLPHCVQFWEPSPYSTRHFCQDQPAQLNLRNNFRIPGESKPPFVVRHVSLKLFIRVLWDGEVVNEFRIQEVCSIKIIG